jgi:hypothetical protein
VTTRSKTTPSAAEIDALYGLEPVYEAGSDPRLVSLVDPIDIDCPWCAETYQTQVDIGEQGQTMVEDCQICCRPIELTVHTRRGNGQLKVDVRRAE